jgi:hypothetical protein
MYLHNHLKYDDFFETVRDINAMPQSKRQELAKLTPEEMTGKPLLPSAAKDHKRQVRLEPDHTPINHDITEDPISVQGGNDESQLPLQQEGSRLGETIRHPPSRRPPGYLGLLSPMNVDPGLVLVHCSCVDATLSFESPNG